MKYSIIFFLNSCILFALLSNLYTTSSYATLRQYIEPNLIEQLDPNLLTLLNKNNKPSVRAKFYNPNQIQPSQEEELTPDSSQNELITNPPIVSKEKYEVKQITLHQKEATKDFVKELRRQNIRIHLPQVSQPLPLLYDKCKNVKIIQNQFPSQIPSVINSIYESSHENSEISNILKKHKYFHKSLANYKISDHVDGVPFQTSILMSQEANPIRMSLLLRTEDRRHGEIYEDTIAANLPPGSYNYVITETGRVIFGKVKDQAEIGVKHFQLANSEKVRVAGQINKTASGKIEYDLESGSYTYNYLQFSEDFTLDQSEPAEISQKLGLLVNEVFNWAPKGGSPPTEVTQVDVGILKSKRPLANPMSFKIYCDDGSFYLRKRKVTDGFNPKVQILSNQVFCESIGLGNSNFH